VPAANDSVNLEADQRVLPHPLDLLAECRVAIKAFAVEDYVDRNDVRLIVKGAGKARDMRPCQHGAAFRTGHLFNVHHNLFCCR
jgi:hypothetical protein